MEINPEDLTVKENYKLLIGTILPRPIAFISSQTLAGDLNLSPFSFFTGVTSNPPTIAFAPARKGSAGTKKDTLTNIEETKECQCGD